MKLKRWERVLGCMGLLSLLVLPVQAAMKNPYNCQKQPKLCEAYVRGVVDSLTQLKEQSDMQDAFSHRALQSRGGQRYKWALGKYCDHETVEHWQKWAKEQKLQSSQQSWLIDKLKDLNGCR